MADEPTPSGWLPPRAPGGEPPPRFEPAPPEPEPEPEPEPAPAGWSHPAAERPAFVRPRDGERNGAAVTALVLGIVGLTLLVATVGLAFLIALPCSIAAWVFAAQARARIASGETSAGGGQAQAAYILGILGVVLGVLAVVGWIVAIAAGLDLEEVRRDLEQQSDPDNVQALRAAAMGMFAASIGGP
jgi:hypothetical protein